LDYDTKIICGEFVDIIKPEYTAVMREAHEKFREGSK